MPDQPTFVAPKRAPIAILGVPFDNVTTTETLELIEAMIATRQPHYLATANVDFVVQALDDEELRRILFEAHLVLCDGMPWSGHPVGCPILFPSGSLARIWSRCSSHWRLGRGIASISSAELRKQPPGPSSGFRPATRTFRWPGGIHRRSLHFSKWITKGSTHESVMRNRTWFLSLSVAQNRRNGSP